MWFKSRLRLQIISEITLSNSTRRLNVHHLSNLFTVIIDIGESNSCPSYYRVSRRDCDKVATTAFLNVYMKETLDCS